MSVKVCQCTSKPLGRPARASVAYRIARRMEAYAFAATPERIGVQEGLRAATAVSVIVAAAVWLHWPSLSWAAFGAFWTCLADPGGSYQSRLVCMGSFGAAGAIAAWIGSASAGVSPVLGGAVLLPLIFLPCLSGTYGAAAAQVGVLVCVVAVVAVAYPGRPESALELAGRFSLGCLWAIILCIGIWRTHPQAPARRAVASVLARLRDMTIELIDLHRRGGADIAPWKAINAEHRRSVRAALERARSQVTELQIGGDRYMLELDLADRIFAGLIAVGHDLEDGRHSTHEELEQRLADKLLRLIAEATDQAARRTPDVALLSTEAVALRRAAWVVDSVVGRAIGAAAQATKELCDALRDRTTGAAIGPASLNVGTLRVLKPIPATVLRHAARVTVAVIVAYLIAMPLNLRFSYWATMATVVVLQPRSASSWPRCLERMVGSIAGGFLAAGLLVALPTKLMLLVVIFPMAAATMAVRSVNYTAFVFFLTPLFIMVIELLQPAAGLPSARIVDNIVGGLVGIAAGLLLWPERDVSKTGETLANAVRANFAFAAGVVAERGMSPALERLRREAGVTSTAAETMRHRMILEGQSKRAHLAEMAAVLESLRRLAGAATATLLTTKTPDRERAAAVQETAGALAEAIKQPSSNARLPRRVNQPCDSIDHAMFAVMEATHAYVDAFGAPPCLVR